MPRILFLHAGSFSTIPLREIARGPGIFPRLPVVQFHTKGQERISYSSFTFARTSSSVHCVVTHELEALTHAAGLILSTPSFLPLSHASSLTDFRQTPLDRPALSKKRGCSPSVRRERTEGRSRGRERRRSGRSGEGGALSLPLSRPAVLRDRRLSWKKGGWRSKLTVSLDYSKIKCKSSARTVRTHECPVH